MVWSKNDYPVEMEYLKESTRNKAIQIANSLLKDDYDKPRAIAMAITQAKQWADKKNRK